MSKILSDYFKYMDRFGLVQPEGKTSQNGIRFTAEYCYALYKHKSLSSMQIIKIKEAVGRCEFSHGLYRRSPTNIGDQEGPDDYHGLMLISKLIQPDIARRILKYGRSGPWYLPSYVYNNLRPGRFSFSAWLGRRQQLIAGLQYAAGERPNLFRRLWVCASLLLSAWGKRNDQDGKVLAWMLVLVCKNQGSWIIDKTCQYWSYVLRRQWSGGIGEILGQYFNNDLHPSAHWLRNEYGDSQRPS